MNLAEILSRRPCNERVCGVRFFMPDYAVTASYFYLHAHYVRGGYADCRTPSAKIAHYLQRLAQIDAETVSPIIGADAEYWPVFAEILENLCLIHGLSQVVSWLNLFINRLYSRSDDFQLYHALMNISSLRPNLGDALIRLSRMGNDDNPYVGVYIRWPICEAIKEVLYIPRPTYWRERWLIAGARYGAETMSELANVVNEALKRANCIKPITSLSEFLP